MALVISTMNLSSNFYEEIHIKGPVTLKRITGPFINLLFEWF